MFITLPSEPSFQASGVFGSLFSRSAQLELGCICRAHIHLGRLKERLAGHCWNKLLSSWQAGKLHLQVRLSLVRFSRWKNHLQLPASAQTFLSLRGSVFSLPNTLFLSIFLVFLTYGEQRGYGHSYCWLSAGPERKSQVSVASLGLLKLCQNDRRGKRGWTEQMKGP